MAIEQNTSLPRAGSDDSWYAELVEPIARWSQGYRDRVTAVSGLGLFRREAPAPPAFCMIEPSIVVVVQGAKRMWIDETAYQYDVSRFLITSLDLPGRSEVIDASVEQPCLGLVLQLDRFLLAELIAQGVAPLSRERGAMSSVGLGVATPTLLAPLARLVTLLDEPAAIDVLAPLIQREIHYRLLQSDQANRLRQIASVDGHGYRIARAIDWLKTHYASPMRIEELASQAQMSTQTFHQYFRQLTTMSPLQYQKRLRLDESRRLMLNEHLDAASAAFRVGYESPSQFSREYSRLFGAPPKRDITNLRRESGLSI